MIFRRENRALRFGCLLRSTFFSAPGQSSVLRVTSAPADGQEHPMAAAQGAGREAWKIASGEGGAECKDF